MVDRGDLIWDTVARLQDGAAPVSADKLIVTISPKVELLFVAAMLAAPIPAPGHYGTLEHPIPQAARTWFAPYTEHPVVHTIRERFYAPEATAFACDALIRFILTYTEPPTLAAYPLAPDSPQPGDVLANQLRDFYQHSQFAAFWTTQVAAYQASESQIAAYARRGWSGEDVVATLEHYFGTTHTAYVLVPTPMERPGGGTVNVLTEPGSIVLACFDSTVDRAWVVHLLYHECGHSFVNPVADQFADLVGRYASLYAPLKAAMRPWGYLTWPIALNEHILRAQNCRLRRQLLGDATAEAQLQLEEQQGFRYIRVLEAKFADYEAQRDRYPSLAAFYPSLLTALDPLLS